MEYLIASASSSISLCQVPVADQADFSLSYQTTHFRTREQLQFTFALGNQTGWDSFQVGIDESWVAHQLVNSLVEIMNNVGDSRKIEEPCLRYPVEAAWSDDLRLHSSQPRSLRYNRQKLTENKLFGDFASRLFVSSQASK